MKSRRFALYLALALSAFTILINQSIRNVSAQKSLSSIPSPPKTRTDNVTETINGITITDPYRWLEDQNSPETRAWIDAQNNYTQKMLSGYSGREALRTQIEKVMKTDSIGM